MKKSSKDNYVRFRIDNVELDRLHKLIGLTRKNKSDLFRESMFTYISDKFPFILKNDGTSHPNTPIEQIVSEVTDKLSSANNPETKLKYKIIKSGNFDYGEIKHNKLKLSMIDNSRKKIFEWDKVLNLYGTYYVQNNFDTDIAIDMTAENIWKLL